MNESFLQSYAAIAVTILIVAGIATAMLVLAHVIGPRRHGPVKDAAYESGMPVIVDARRRLNIRFYVVAMLFMLFDVEVIFLWPWATAFYAAATEGKTFPLESGGVADKNFLLVGMGIFFALLLFGLIYEWKKGALDWA
ncbi:MAG: NADH-quinone oxidoreductase subunit A [Planctomycetes bacterium]|nr:NADH-quinone oxidoreductase subunit A [Planctomycetota bacterium]